MSQERLPTIEELAALAGDRAEGHVPASRLRAAIDLGRELTELSDELIGRFVAEARASGLSWTEIGRAFGTSKQAVQQRYGAAVDDLGRWPGRWTPAANDALDQAGEEARRLGRSYVGTEHVVLALVTAERGTAGEVLRALGVSRDRMLATSCMQGGADDHEPREPLSVMPRLKQALERGRHVADGLGERRADTEHLLAGILAVPDCMAVEILRRLGVSADAARAALAERLDVDPQRLGARRRRRRRLLGATR
jgi:Clp amino terminal domain, pathogenicity island component